MARFSDTQLIQILGKAARRVNRQLCLTGTDDEISVDASGCVSPSNGDLEDLVLLQAECMLSSRDFNLDLNSGAVGVRAVDGEQSLDTREKAKARGDYYNSPYSPCAEFEKQIKLEKIKRSCGKMVW